MPKNDLMSNYFRKPQTFYRTIVLLFRMNVLANVSVMILMIILCIQLVFLFGSFPYFQYWCLWSTDAWRGFEVLDEFFILRKNDLQ